MTWLDCMEELADNPTLSKTDFRVLFKLTALQIQGGEFFVVTQASIAADMKLARSAVSRAIQRLIAAGFVETDTSRGVKGYRISPLLHYRGPLRRAKTERKKARRAKLTVIDGGAS